MHTRRSRRAVRSRNSERFRWTKPIVGERYDNGRRRESPDDGRHVRFVLAQAPRLATHQSPFSLLRFSFPVSVEPSLMYSFISSGTFV